MAAQSLVPQMEDFVEGKNPELITLPVLEGRDLAIKLKRYFLQGSREDILTFDFSLYDQKQEHVVGSVNLDCIYYIQKTDQGFVIQGQATYSNETNHNPDPTKRYTEMTLLLSPLDDALAQAMANHYQVEVVRAVRTDYDKVKRLFEERGFLDCDPHSFPIKPIGRAYQFNLIKKFSPADLRQQSKL